MTNRGAVVVTGASSGIGYACAVGLAARGFRVFAGVRSADSADTLRRANPVQITPVQLDVTKPDSIRSAAAQIDSAVGAIRLRGLVNNAGVAVAAPLEFIPIDALREQLEVNVVGQIAVTQALLPLLRVGHGRIVNIGSISGRVALPFMGAYSASKFALEALTDALRMELRFWGIQVSIVEPGAIDTPIWTRSLAAADAMLERLPRRAHELYGKPLAILRRRVQEMRGIPPEAVVRAVLHALTARRARPRYVVGTDARLRLGLNWLPTRARDSLITKVMR